MAGGRLRAVVSLKIGLGSHAEDSLATYDGRSGDRSIRA
jgi:hypothetical protein